MHIELVRGQTETITKNEANAVSSPLLVLCKWSFKTHIPYVNLLNPTRDNDAVIGGKTLPETRQNL